MKDQYDGRGLKDLVNLGREQGYLTLDQLNDGLPRNVTSPDHLRMVLESLEGIGIKVFEEVSGQITKSEAESDTKREPQDEAVDLPRVG
jgi:RNA polymerase primary sigma factor